MKAQADQGTLPASRRLRPQPLPPGVLPLIVLRGLRSLAQACLGVVFPLYLLRLGVSTLSIGVLFTVSAAVSAGMTLTIGILADRFGRKSFVVVFAVLTALAGAVFLVTRNFWVLAPVAVVAGFGRGGLGIGGGQGGPFSPALQALLAEKTGAERRTSLFALASAVGAYAAAAGAALSGLADWLATPAHPLQGYRALFLLTFFCGLLMIIAVLPVREERPAGPAPARLILSRQAWSVVGKLSVSGALNGLGWGFVMGFFPVWLHLRFGSGPAAVGLLTAATALVSGPGFALATFLARRLGMVRTVAGFRLAAPAVMALLPLSRSFAQAAVLYIVALLFTMAVVPVRQSFAMEVVDQRERAAAAGIRATATRLPSALSPTLSGYFLSVGDLAFPFWGMAICMAAGALTYYWFFRDRDPPWAARRP